MNSKAKRQEDPSKKTHNVREKPPYKPTELGVASKATRGNFLGGALDTFGAGWRGFL